jgi:hypothetical protein
MNKIQKSLFAVSAMLLISCSVSNDEPLNAITDLKKFGHSAAEAKYQKVIPINKEDLCGDWTMVSSFFTVISQQLVTTFQLEGRKYTINEDGSLIINNAALGHGKKTANWKLKSNNTVFDDGFESMHVRIKGDTMEWIEQMDEDYSYFVLVK